MRAPFLACGVEGSALGAGERRLLEELQPGGVVLFARNVVDADQLTDLVAALRDLPSRPYVAIDLEGGRVNRLRSIFGELPSASVAAAAGSAAAHALGAVCGSACAHLGITVDFAPVLDVARSGGYLGGEDRCLGNTPAAVEANAAAFLAGLEGYGVASCLKHFPGLGSGTVDSHASLPELDDGVADDCAPFGALAHPLRAVMVAHALAPSLGDGMRPATLSPGIVARARAPVCGPVIGDDLEMGALAEYGSIPERAAAALLAGCDQVLVCNALHERAATVAHLERWRSRSPELEAALRRAATATETYGRGTLAMVPREEVEARLEACWRLCGGRP